MTEWTFDLPTPLEDVVIAAENAAVAGEVSDGVDGELVPALDADVEDGRARAGRLVRIDQCSRPGAAPSRPRRRTT